MPKNMADVTAPGPVSTSVAAVARAAGVSAMTVSRVFRNSPRVAPETRRRVLEAAAATGYQPDPHVARLMERVRSHRLRRIRAKLALVRDESPEDELHDASYNYVALEDVRRRAEQHGYDVEEFMLGRGRIGPERLGVILRTRGIGGALVSAQSSQQLAARMDYSGLAAATFGYGLRLPELHRSSTNMTRGILTAASILEARGYRRIGVAVSPWIDERADNTYSGALLHYQQTVPSGRRVPLLLFPRNDLKQGEAVFRAWMRRHRPDVVITFHRQAPAWLRAGLGLRIPEDVGLVVHDWVRGVPEMGEFAGIDHRREQVAAAGVDLVATQLQQNEHGVPAVPRQILIPPRFVDGASIRAGA